MERPFVVAACDWAPPAPWDADGGRNCYKYGMSTYAAGRTLPVSLTEGSIVRALVRLSIPIVLANILQTAYQITDTFWVGRLSAEAVAAVSLCFPINFLLIAIGGGLPIAGSVLISQYKGGGDDRAMNHVAAQTLLMVLWPRRCCSRPWAMLLSEPIMRLMGAEPAVLPDAVRFLQITFLGFVFVFGFFVFQTLMRGLGVVGTADGDCARDRAVESGARSAVHFRLGAGARDGRGRGGDGHVVDPGAGGRDRIRADVSRQSRPALAAGRLPARLAMLLKAFRLGLPASVEQSTRALGLTLMTLLVSSFGTIVVAAYGIGIRVLTFIIIPAMGLAMATSTLVGQNIGAGKLERAERTTLVAGLLSFFGPLVAGIPMFFFARQLAAFFVPESPAVIAQAATFIRIMSLAFGCIGLQHVLAGTLRGAGNTTAAMIIALVSQWVVLFPLAYILSRHTSLGARGIWWSYPIATSLSATVSLLWFLGGTWKRTKLIDEVRLEQQVSEEVRIDEGIPS